MLRRTELSKFFAIFILAPLLGLAACSTPSHRTPSQPLAIPSTTSVNLRDQDRVKSLLLQQYKEWYKVPYKMGGLSKGGVDCSGFTYLTFRNRLGYTIPRSTDGQVQIGTRVARNSLRIGDLIFFHTSAFYNHVGIYIGEDTFLHASTSRGVMISNMKIDYWNSRYWTARRVAD